MNRRVLCLLTAALLAALPLSTVLACEHYPGQYTEDDLIPDEYRAPGQETWGWLKNLRCPACGEICEARVDLPPLGPPASHPAASDAETVQTAPAQETPQETSKETVREDPSAEKARPAEEAPAAQPSAEASSSAGETARAPSGAAAGTASEQPAVSAGSGKPVSAVPEVPASGDAASGEQAVTLPGGFSPVSGSGAALPQAKETRGNARPQTAASAGSSASSGASSGKSAAAASEQPAQTDLAFPYRWLRLNPVPGILAPAAGDLIWPLAETPFRILFGE